MKFIAIIQGRMNSERLPGKVLRPIGGYPLIHWTLQTCRSVKSLESVVVATSDQESDEPIVRWCEENGVDCIRGSLENVAGRFVTACRQFPSDVFFRVNADSPMINRRLFELAIQSHNEEELDLVTNIMPRTFPPGLSIEAIRTDTFLGLGDVSDAEDREHVTRFFYRNADRFKIHNLESGVDFADAHLAVDTEDDYQGVERVLGIIGEDPGGVSFVDLARAVAMLNA